MPQKLNKAGKMQEYDETNGRWLGKATPNVITDLNTQVIKNNKLEFNLKGSNEIKTPIANMIKANEEIKEEEHKKIDELLKEKKGYKSVEMSNGQIIERYDKNELVEYIIKPIKESGIVHEDDVVNIWYNDGSYARLDNTIDEKTIKKTKLSNIKAIIYENASTSGYAGEGITIENYNETQKDWGQDDWRIDYVGNKTKYSSKNYDVMSDVDLVEQT